MSGAKTFPLGLIVVFLLVAACAPGAEPEARPQTDPALTGQPKMLTIAVRREPKPEVGSVPESAYVHHNLVTTDNLGNPLMILAAELPSQDKGTWVVNPDGTMTTTYRLRPNIRWHDGAPLLAQDFVFAWTFSNDPELPIGTRAVAAQITQIDAPDDLTLVLKWGSPYPLADRISSSDLGPYPVHLLREIYESDKGAFERADYWGKGFVGVGPYRLHEWAPGSHIDMRAFEGYHLGRPKIGRITIRYLPDEQTVVANMLAGGIDGLLRAIDFEKVVLLKNEMERRGTKPFVLAEPSHTRILRVQYGPEPKPSPPEITDVRVRRALLHAIDRDTMAEIIYPGYRKPADIIIPIDDPRYEWVKDVVVRYPYDSRLAQALLSEVGWRRAADGTIRDATGDRVYLHIQTNTGGQWEAQQAITADAWRAVGLVVEEKVFPVQAARDREARSRFQGFDGSVVSFSTLAYMRQFQISQCPSAANRWAGNNLGCYADPEVDRISSALFSTINPGDQRRLWRELIRLQTVDLPALPLFYHIQGTVFREGFTGMIGEAREGGGGWAWNVLEWDIR